MICRLCLNTLDEHNAVMLFGTGSTTGAGATAVDNDSSSTTNDNNGTGINSSNSNNNNNNNINNNKTATPESYLVQLISIHLYLCLSRDDAISTSICSECRAQLESFHNFWKLVELKQTTLCSQFLEIDCDVNWSEEGGDEADPEVEVEAEAEAEAEAEVEADGAEVESEDMVSIVKVEPHDFNEAVYISRSMVEANAKKFPCMFCEKSFKMRRYLEEHIATHTGDRPIACPYCEMAFRCRSNMYTHVKSKHTAQWLKARAERDAAKSQQATAQPTQPPPPAPVVHIKTEPLDEPPPPPAPTPVPAPTPAPPQPQPAPQQNEPMEAINLSLSKAKTRPQPITRSISRRKTHSPKKVQSTVADCSDEASSDSNPEEQVTNLLPQKRFKENEIMLANYNAVAAAVVAAASLNPNTNNTNNSSSSSSNNSRSNRSSAAAAAGGTGGRGAASTVDSLQQRLCASLIQQHQQDLFHAMTTAASSMAAAAAAAAATSNYPSVERPSHANHLHKKQSAATTAATAAAPAPPPAAPAPPSSIFASSICANCGELPGQNHRCLTKAKYACDVCGKCFKMKRYLEEHFATHTGVKLHTCAFCPTEFRSKSNMYHHTKRKHKVEWERSRATRNAAKTSGQDQQQQQQQAQQSSQQTASV